MEQWDVIIVGAGVAGLEAAVNLSKSGLRVLVVEARDRIGGRIFSLPGPDPDYAIELGAEFVHGKPRLFDDYLQQHGLELRETAGRNYCVGTDGPEPWGSAEPGIFEGLANLDTAGTPDEPFDVALQHLFPDAPEGNKRWARSFVEGFHAADPARISTHSIIADALAEEETEGDRAFHIVGGYARLVDSLYGELPQNVQVLTSAPVMELDWGGDAVIVTVSQLGWVRRFEATRAVITLPLGVLQQEAPAPGAVCFRPPLAEKRHALERLAMGPVVRMVMQFRSRFWEDATLMRRHTLRNLHFLFTRDEIFPTFWTPMPLNFPMLTAWCGGPIAERKHGRSHATVEAEGLRVIARVIRIPDATVRSYFVRSYFHDWQDDPFSRGAYSYVLVGGMGAQEELARPLRDRLFFAGEATQSDGHHATVHGAFASGCRAAGEILNSVGASRR